jgi:hypothetical protein
VKVHICGFRKSVSMATIATVLLAGIATNSYAAASSGQDTLNVTNSSTQLLSQVSAGAGATVSVLPDVSAENSWLSGLHASGYLSQTFGMWQNPSALRDFTPSRNNLAVSRTLLQVDENYRLNENNNFFMREWFVYEPPYSWDSANIRNYTSVKPASYGHFMNDWYNTYQVRDAWWENKTGPLTTYIGNQIVVWGQSIAFRVGDVINPQDTTWSFGFSNLEQSRNAQWMVHPILNLPQWGPLTSNFLELVVQPGFAPQWWECDYPDGRYSGDCETKGGRGVTGDPSAMHGPSARFDAHYDNQAKFGLNAPLGFGPYGPGGAGIVAQPAAHEFWSCAQLAPMVRPGFIPKGTPQATCALGLSKGNLPYGPTGDGALVDIGPWRIPGMQPQNWNIGGRFHTLIGSTEITALYYLDSVYGVTLGNPASLRWTPFTNLWTYEYPQVNEVGLTADRPLPMPASLGEYLPLVGRAEFLYVNHQSFPDMRPTSLTGQRYSDVVRWMAALDIDQAYAPWLTSTGNLTANLEVTDVITMDNAKTMPFNGNDVSEANNKNEVNALLNIGTAWLWNDIQPAWTMIYNPKGTTFLLFPSLVLNPPWTKSYFMKLQAIEVLGSDRESLGGGLFKGESLLTAQFQYNFNLL